jgi:hypothetical protein
MRSMRFKSPGFGWEIFEIPAFMISLSHSRLSKFVPTHNYFMCKKLPVMLLLFSIHVDVMIVKANKYICLRSSAVN